MSGMSDSVSKVWVLRPDARGGLNIDGFGSLDEAALQLLFFDNWRPGWEERIAAFKLALDERFEKHTHEHDWVDSVEGPDVVGKHCSTCGAVYEYGD